MDFKQYWRQDSREAPQAVIEVIRTEPARRLFWITLYLRGCICGAVSVDLLA